MCLVLFYSQLTTCLILSYHFAYTLINYSYLLSWDRASLQAYGEDHLDSIISHYSSYLEESQVEFNAVACKDAWLELKLHYSRSGLQLPADQPWNDLFSNPQLCEWFSNVLVMVELCLVMPVQTTCCERGNSCLNRVMVDSRSGLLLMHSCSSHWIVRVQRASM